MVWRVFVVVMFVAASCVVSGAQEAEWRKITRAEEEVRKLERRWLDAYEQRDPVAMDRIVADDFTITFPNGGMQTKPQLMAMIKSPRRAGQPRMRFYTDGVLSRAYGGTVILAGRVTTEYERDGKTVKEQSRYTDTYVRMGGRWQVVASHLSHVEEPKSPGAEK
ncbi:MAG: nuclear transport factor 2 family protein [Pyrinomonadaceae bacterium]